MSILGPETERALAELAELERTRGRRLWAAILLARDVWTCRSIVRGLPVRVGNLEPLLLRRAFRGRPHPEDYVVIGHAELDAVAEAGPLLDCLPIARGGK